MSINQPFTGPEELPAVFPVFPLAGALLLPRGDMPLNIFEPRYMTMVDDALRTHRLLAMIQPDPVDVGSPVKPNLCAVGCLGKITQFAETGSGRYFICLTGIARFRLHTEVETMTPYRQCSGDFEAYRGDFSARAGEENVDRAGVIAALKLFARSIKQEIDWKSIHDAPNEALVNALSIMSPFGPKEKQALLEAVDLKTRADVLIAITEMELARGRPEGATLQ